MRQDAPCMVPHCYRTILLTTHVSKKQARSCLRICCGPIAAVLRIFSAFVDTLLDNLTVYEMLAYTAELKNPMKEPFERKRAKVEMVIQQLGLNGCRGVRIGNPLARGISGGEYRFCRTLMLAACVNRAHFVTLPPKEWQNGCYRHC